MFYEHSHTYTLDQDKDGNEAMRNAEKCPHGLIMY